MEQKVPGGRKASTAEEEFGYDSEPDESRLTHRRPLGPPCRSGSHSLPRLLHPKDSQNGGTNRPSDLRKLDFFNSPSLLHQSYTMDHKKKSRRLILQSFGHLVQKLLRQISTSSQPAASLKTVKSKAQPKSSSAGESDEAWNTFKGKNAALCAQKLTLKSDPRGNGLPGVIGIQNHGNTCFMNAVLQCLSNTEQLVIYFISDQYKDDIKRNNKQNAKKYGTRGELTENLATLLKSLWTCRYASEISADFKATVGKYGNQYRGFAQHDAQEFLLWLLDKIHEDLNIAMKKKYRANKASHGRPDEVVAAEALANHARCNNSFIYDLFQALYQSSLTCPNCSYHSNTFDPFLSVSLPLPHVVRPAVCVTVVYLSATPKQVRIGLLMNPGSTMADLRSMLANDTKIPEDQMVLVESYADGYFHSLHGHEPIRERGETETVYAIEIPPTSSNSSDIVIIAINCVIGDKEVQRFGEPVVLQMSRNCTFQDVQKELLTCMQARLYERITPSQADVLFRLHLIDGINGSSFQLPETGSLDSISTVDRILSNWDSKAGPPHLTVSVEWNRVAKEHIIASDVDVVEEHESVRQVRLAQQQPSVGTLDDCFQVYTQKEQLDADDAWFCPNCRKRQQGTVKSLALWSLPKVLVVHLKRFKQDASQRTKLNTLVTFPITGLDMSHHVANTRTSSLLHGGQQMGKPESAWMTWRPGRRPIDASDQYTYDLYAVCNHYGNMQGGHYTAFCKNPASGKWYSFNDDRATEIGDDEVVTRAAYLLFYQKRSARFENPSDSSDWLHQLQNIEYSSISRTTTSHSLDNLLDSDRENTKKDVHEEEASIPPTTPQPPKGAKPEREVSLDVSSNDASAKLKLKHLPSPTNAVAMTSLTTASAWQTTVNLPEATCSALLAAEPEGTKCNGQGLHDDNNVLTSCGPQLQVSSLDGTASWPDAKSVEKRLVESGVDLFLLQESCV